MAYDEDLAERVRDELIGDPDVTERTMFGGLGFMVGSRMAVAAGSGGELMVRADPADAEQWIDRAGVRPMHMRGKPVRGWLLVDAETLADEAALSTWVGRGVTYARSLPPRSG